MPRRPLSPRQAAIYEYILWHVEQFGFQPTRPEIRARFKMGDGHLKATLQGIRNKRYFGPSQGRYRALVLRGVKFKRVIDASET